MNDDVAPAGYTDLLSDLKHRIGAARVRAALAVNRELVELYWHIGTEILARQEAEGWGGKVIERLSRDLRSAFPEMRGLSVRNLRYARAFADAWRSSPIVQQPAAQFPPNEIMQIPWTHNHVLLDKLAERETRLWYAHQTVQHGWSRNVLALHIDHRLHERQGAALTNFPDTLPRPQSDLAIELVKSEYNFDFLGVGTEAHERAIENGLIDHVRKFLLELGSGFAFLGNQFHLQVGGEDFYIDLLLYHVKLRCYIVIELKAGSFKPAYSGQMNFYLSAVDDLVRDAEHDQPTVGILLCRDHDTVVVEYALRDMRKPVGVSTYLTEELPRQLAERLTAVTEVRGAS